MVLGEKMINLCYVINVAKNQGPCNVIYNLASALPREKYKLHLVTLYCGNDENLVLKFKEHGVAVKALDYSDRISCFFHVKHDLTGYCKANSIDIIHSHTLFSDLSVSKLKNITQITTIHNRTFEDYRYLFGAFWGKIIAKAHINIFKKFDMCVCCSKSVLAEQKKYLKNISAVQNGIHIPNSNHCVGRNSLQIPDEACVFVYVGSISKRKNVVKMIELFVKNRRESDYLLILGEGEELEKCKAVSDDHIKFLGFVDNPGDYYAIGDVYISASLSEGLSLSQLESMSMGLKQLVSNILSHREVVELDPVIGQAFNEDNFADAYLKVVDSLDPETKSTITGLFINNFSVENMVRGYDEIYSSFWRK